MNCLLFAFSRVLNVTPEYLIKAVGHNGKEICWPELSEPNNMRTFHPEEFIDVALRLGYAFVTISKTPILCPNESEKEIIALSEIRFYNHLAFLSGVVVGEKNGMRHAWAKIDDLLIDRGGSEMYFKTQYKNSFEIFYPCFSFLY